MTRVALLTLLGALATMPGCVVQDARGRPVRSGQRSVDQPEGIEARYVVLGVDTALDTNDDGWIDTIPARVWLFGSDPDYDLPLWLDGHFEFTLTGDEGETIASWTFTREETESMRLILGQIGPGYGVLLRLDGQDRPDAGTSRAGALSCVFVPAEGEPVRNDRPISVLIGATGWDRPG